MVKRRLQTGQWASTSAFEGEENTVGAAITGQSGGTTWCSAVGMRTSAATCAGYDEEVANLAKGVAAFDPPRQMIKGQMVVVRLAIARDDGAMPSRAEEMIGGGGSAEVRQLQIGAKMRAELKGGRAFDIDPPGPQDKFMGRSREQVWAWNVTPQLAGKHGLSATITVLAADGTILDNYESKAIEVDVAVSAAEARDANRAKTRESFAWYQEVGTSLTKLWYVWLGLMIAVAAGVWRLIRTIRTGKDPGAGGAAKPAAGPDKAA